MTRLAQFFGRAPLRWKVVSIMLGVAGSSLLLVGAGLLLYERAAFERHTERKLTLLADVIGLNSTAALAFDDRAAAGETLMALRSDAHVMAGALYDAHGRLFARYLRNDIERTLPPTAPAVSAVTFGDGEATLVHTITLNGRPVGKIYLAADTAEWSTVVWGYIGIVTILFVAVLTFGLFVSIWLQRFITDPITDLADLTRRIGQERDYTLRAVKRSDNELGTLVDGLNGMLDAIAAGAERFRRVVESAPSAVILVNADGRLTLVNAQTETMFGYPRDELIGQAVELLVPERFRGGHPEHRRSFFAGPSARPMGAGRNLYGLRKDGREFPVEIGLNPIATDEGTLVLGSIIDITERKRTEDEIRKLNQDLERRVAERTAELAHANEALQLQVAEREQAERRFRAVAETANDAIVSGDSSGTIIYFNPAAERNFGRAAVEVLGQPLTVLMPERFRAAHREGLRRFLAGGEPRVIGRTVELAGRRKDGSEFPADVSLANWRVGGADYFTAIMRDITDRKQAEGALRDYAAQLEGANKELEAFSYSVSHDLRAPLRAIDGFSRLLLDEHAAALSAEGRDSLARVRRGAQRMGMLIDDLLKLSRVTRTEPNREAVDLSALARDVVEALRGQDPDRNVEFVAAQGLRVGGDPRLLRIALENLLGNAWKFTGKRADARVELGVKTLDGSAAYFVCDNGIGFDATYVGKLFTPFQRLHALDEFPGTGIGLATVQRIIHKHGGRIWAESADGKGATFYFTIA